MDDRKPAAKKRKVGEPPTPLCACPACESLFETEISLTAHILRSNRCCKSIYLMANRANIASLENKPTTRNLQNELKLASIENLASTHEHQDENQIPAAFDDSNESVIAEQDLTNTAKQSNICFSTNDLVEIDLLKLLHNANTPHYLYKEILDWGK